MKFAATLLFLTTLASALPLGLASNTPTITSEDSELFYLEVTNSTLPELNGVRINRRFASNRDDSELGYYPGEEIGFSGYLTPSGRFELQSLTGPQSVCIDDSHTRVPNHVAYIREGTQSKAGFSIRAGGLLGYREDTRWLLCHADGVYALVTGESNCNNSDIFAAVELAALNNGVAVPDFPL